MKHGVLVSCIVPAFNSARYVREALESIFAQTHRPIEVIVVDDGSSDETVAIVTAYGNDGRCTENACPVELYRQQTSGPAATRNLGLRHANGELVAFLDADDLWHPRKLELQVERFTRRPELDICVTHAKMFWPAELAEEREHYAEHQRAGALPGYATTTLMARRSAFERIGTFDRQLWFADATQWFVRARELGVVSEILPEVLTFHRMHGGNLTRRRREASRDEFVHLVKAALDRRRGGAS